MTFLVLPAGVWADRMSRRRLMLVSDLGRAVVQALTAALLLGGGAELWHLIVLSALYGALEAFFRPAAGGLTPALVPPDELQQANALIGLAQNVGHVRRPRGRGRADRRPQPGRGARRRRRDVRRLRRVPGRAARARPHAAPARARPALLDRAQAGHRRGPAAPLDARLHARLLGVPPRRAALRARPRRGAGRPGAGRRRPVGGDLGLLRRGHDPRLGDRPALEAAAADAGRRDRVRRRLAAARDHRPRRIDRRDRRLRGARRRSRWRSASPSGRRRSAGSSRASPSRGSPRWTGSPPSG